MSKRPTGFISGDWNAICDSCGFTFLASELRQKYDNAFVCSGCWEPRHPQELLRTRKDKITVSYSRPEAEDIFVEVTYTETRGCTAFTMLCQADLGTANCATVGNVNGGYIL